MNIVNAIEKHWSSKSTGALFIKIDNGKLLQAYFANGEIKSARFNGVKGLSALDGIASMSALGYQFHEGAVTQTNDDLPATQIIISACKSGRSVTSIKDEALQVAVMSDDDKKIIKKILASYIGPIAEMVVEEVLEDTAIIDEVVKGVTLQIDSESSQNEFKEKVMQALNN